MNNSHLKILQVFIQKTKNLKCSPYALAGQRIAHLKFCLPENIYALIVPKKTEKFDCRNYCMQQKKDIKLILIFQCK